VLSEADKLASTLSRNLPKRNATSFCRAVSTTLVNSALTFPAGVERLRGTGYPPGLGCGDSDTPVGMDRAVSSELELVGTVDS
jgi:hypothetical protein